MDRTQLAEHLKFAAELGVAGVSRDPAWRTRAQSLAVRKAPDDRTAGPDAPAPLVPSPSNAHSATVFGARPTRWPRSAPTSATARAASCTRSGAARSFGVGNRRRT
jgi:hypothetical protein